MVSCGGGGHWNLLSAGLWQCRIKRGCSTPAGAASAGLQSLNHIIVMAQENRSLDNYFGAMHQYWQAHGYTDQAFDGLPQFNNPAGAAPTNPGCDPAFPFDPSANPPQLNQCMFDSNSPAIASYQYQTLCVENPRPIME